MPMTAPTLLDLAGALDRGEVTSLDLVEACLARIDAPEGQGAVAFRSVDHCGARRAAAAQDALRAAGAAPSPFAGIPVSVKDLFDVRGQVTRAGSVVLDGPPAAADAPAVARLRRAGFVVIGRNTMTEFAFSGLGLNPHTGDPLSPWRRHERRISGGSSSGGAVAVADGMAHLALGTDTGGSCRIPAAWCGLVGAKPTATRVPRGGAVPLSTTLDSIGPIARSVTCAAIVDAILAGEEPAPPAAAVVAGLRLGVVETVVLDGLDAHVAAAFEAALARLSKAGAHVRRLAVAPFARVADINAKGGFSAAEAYAWHAPLLEAKGGAYDPRVAMRIRRGADQTARDYVELLQARRVLIRDVADAVAGVDALVMPTTPTIPPRLDAFVDDVAYLRINALALRNASLINLIDGCAISIPIPAADDAPVGLTLAGLHGADRHLYAVARGVESALRR